MDAFHRLSQLSSTVKERVSPAVWKLAFRLIAGLVFVALLAVIVPRVWELGPEPEQTSSHEKNS